LIPNMFTCKLLVAELHAAKKLVLNMLKFVPQPCALRYGPQRATPYH
jgi:hypothetical protein